MHINRNDSEWKQQQLFCSSGGAVRCVRSEQLVNDGEHSWRRIVGEEQSNFVGELVMAVRWKLVPVFRYGQRPAG